jgi:hypothetical protein
MLLGRWPVLGEEFARGPPSGVASESADGVPGG